MPTQATVLREVRRFIECARIDCDSDRALVERFARKRDERAFAELVRRHGPLVLGVCRRVLRHSADAEDAFQATFLILVRKAASIRDPARLGPSRRLGDRPCPIAGNRRHRLGRRHDVRRRARWRLYSNLARPLRADDGPGESDLRMIHPSFPGEGRGPVPAPVWTPAFAGEQKCPRLPRTPND